MALIPPLKDIQERKPVDGGQEYDLRITNASKKKYSSGRNGVQLIIDFVDEDYAKPIFHYVLFGNDGEYTGDDEESSNNWWERVKKFCTALGLNSDDGLEIEDFEDLTFTAIVEYDDGCNEDGVQEYEPSNKLGKITGH